MFAHKLLTISRCVQLSTKCTNHRSALLLPKYFATKAGDSSNKNDDENNVPIKYLGSQAFAWKAKQSRGGNDHEVPWFQPLVVTGSVAVFLLYFCVLREENDIDRKLEISLFDHVPKLEETQLIVTYKYNIEHGIDVKDIEQRMKELGMQPPDLTAAS